MHDAAPDIEADWTMFLTCNYVCDYCFFTPEQLRSKLVVAAGPAQWQHAFDATGLVWLIHLTGGEPTALPGFAELCQRLAVRHRLSLNTNLSLPSIREFADRVDPARVVQINASFHPDERRARAGDATFIAHVNLLRAKGFAVLVSFVATPQALANLDDIAARLDADRIVAVPKVLRSQYRGLPYPQSYTAAERAAFAVALARARAHYGPPPAASPSQAPGRWPIDPFDDDRYLAGLPDFLGRRCEAGRRFVRIDPRGNVTRCPDSALGNLLEGSFRQATTALLCASHYCHYWCQRHADLTEPHDRVLQRRALVIELGALRRDAQAAPDRRPAIEARMQACVSELQALLR